MTRDEHREACIEAMRKAMRASSGIEVDFEECTPNVQLELSDMATAAFDAIRTAGPHVVPEAATEEMLRAALPISVKTSSDPELWRAMSAAGDLTNPPERPSRDDNGRNVRGY